VFPAEVSLTHEQILSDEAVQSRMQRFFPRAEPYEIVHRNLYVIHQRVASTFRKGRVLLAGDSAHVNNSIGGMGLNGGLQDAANLSEKLAKLLLDGAPDNLLDLYSLQRRTVSIEYVQQQSIANKKRLEAKDPEVRRRNFEELSESAADPVKAREFLLRTAMISMQRRAASITLAEAT
jgi:3-(3-hydroxy-phenyl)propionate hydroxylase